MDTQFQLRDAIRSKDLAAIKALLHAGADPNLYPGFRRPSSFMEDSAAQNFLPGLETLHAAGGQVDIRSEGQCTPLMGAAVNGHVEAGQWLLRHGADVHAKGSKGDTALSLALEQGHLAFADMLLHEVPQLGTKELNQVAQAILYLRNPAVAEWMLAAGANPNLTIADGNSWLMAAQSSDHSISAPLSEALVKAGADVNHQNDNGDTALHFAVQYGEISAFMRLLRAGARADLANNNGDTVRYLVLTNGTIDLKRAFEAWQASCTAHQIIEDDISRSDLRPL